MLDILDKIVNLAQESGWIIAYIAINKESMAELVDQVKNAAGLDATPQSLADYKGVKLAVKDIIGLQVSYSFIQ